MASRSSNSQPWASAEKGQVHTAVIETVSEIDRRQSDLFERFYRLECLYDPNGAGASQGERVAEQLGIVSENVIASSVDTVTAAVSATDVRARFMTDGADWSMQRQARHMEWYAEGVGTQLEVAPKCRKGFKSAAKKGAGVNHVYVDRFGQIRVDPILLDDVMVDERECRNGDDPKQLHILKSIDADDLKAMYPGNDDEIERARATGTYRQRRARADMTNHNDVTVTFSWRLPCGVKDKPGYRAGREAVTINGHDLLDRDWHKTTFPIAVIRWSEREGGWYGISLAERIAGHQRALNKMNWQIERIIDQSASVTTFVRPADSSITVRSQSKLGTIAVCKGDYPHTVAPPAVHPEIYQAREQRKASAFEEGGISRMAAQSVKPAGIDSGVALREYRDQTTQRFALQEEAFERFVLDTIWLVIDCCKDLGKAAPVIMRRTKFGAKKITWAKVDMGDVRVQIAAASTLSRTPAGRTQTVLEWAQAGVISQDETRRLLQHPDLERAMSLYTAALENIEHCFDEIADGKIVMPEPFMNLKMIAYRGQLQYLNWRDDGAPEDILEALRQFVVQAAYMLSQQAQNDNTAAAPGGQAGAMPSPNAPPEAPPQAALAPQAMQLRAG